MPKKWIPLAALASLLCLTALLFPAACTWIITAARPAPAEVSETLFQGITYRRLVRSSPRPMVIHVVQVDLRQPDIAFLVTPGDPDEELPLRGRTTSQFVEEFGLQVAINGDGVTPWRANGPLDYYPRSGDPVDPIGFSASQGVVYSQHRDNEPTIYISRTNRVTVNNPPGKVYNAISGNMLLISKGNIVEGLPDDDPQPRTAVAVDRRSRELILAVIDGRQPGYSEGATLQETAALLLELNGYHGINLDGGGSSTLVIDDGRGRARVLNSPINFNIPGSERVVGNHLGIYAAPANNKK